MTADEPAAAREAVAAGAEDVHPHPEDRDGRDTLEATAVAAAVSAVRVAVPGVAVGVTTGAWATADPRARAVAGEPIGRSGSPAGRSLPRPPWQPGPGIAAVSQRPGAD